MANRFAELLPTKSSGSGFSWHPKGCAQPRALAPMPPLALTEFADGLEKSDTVRRSARETGKLIHWPTPETVGIASMTLGL